MKDKGVFSSWECSFDIGVFSSRTGGDEFTAFFFVEAE